MTTLSRGFTALMISAAVLLAGCATNLYQNMPQAYFHEGSGALTLADISSQNAAQTRCVKVANQTTPTNGQAAWYYGTRYAAGGFIGGGAGSFASSKIMDVAITGATVGSAALYYGLASGFVGAFAGPINNDIIKRNTDVWCRALDAYGIKMFPPSAAKKLMNGNALAPVQSQQNQVNHAEHGKPSSPPPPPPPM